jgi:hypothetical protein
MSIGVLMEKTLEMNEAVEIGRSEAETEESDADDSVDAPKWLRHEPIAPAQLSSL